MSEVGGVMGAFSPDPGRDLSHLMTAADAINQQYGRGSIQLASAGITGAKRR
ncbi:MAG: DUF4113 domain-containing protein [Variovorax sp.]|nr:MAG: DUF4113 domain-containing protein [Variovorax sp.]